MHKYIVVLIEVSVLQLEPYLSGYFVPDVVVERKRLGWKHGTYLDEGLQCPSSLLIEGIFMSHRPGRVARPYGCQAGGEVYTKHRVWDKFQRCQVL